MCEMLYYGRVPTYTDITSNMWSPAMKTPTSLPACVLYFRPQAMFLHRIQSNIPQGSHLNMLPCFHWVTPKITQTNQHFMPHFFTHGIPWQVLILQLMWITYSAIWQRVGGSQQKPEFHLSLATFWLCDIGQIIQPFWISVFLFAKQSTDSHFS